MEGICVVCNLFHKEFLSLTEFFSSPSLCSHFQIDYVPTSSRECIPGYDDCQDNEMCRRDQTNGRNMCVCQVGYTQDVYGDCVYDDSKL